MPETSDLYQFFTILGDAGFYFPPIFIANFAAQQHGVSSVVAMLLAAMMMHPTIVQFATDASADAMGAGDPVTFAPLGVEMSLQNYSSQVLPSLLVVWAMSYVERFLRAHTPDVLKVVAVPFGTYLVMAPIALYILGPSAPSSATTSTLPSSPSTTSRDRSPSPSSVAPSPRSS